MWDFASMQNVVHMFLAAYYLIDAPICSFLDILEIPIAGSEPKHQEVGSGWNFHGSFFLVDSCRIDVLISFIKNHH